MSETNVMDKVRLFDTSSQSIIEQLTTILWRNFETDAAFSPDEILFLYQSYEKANIRSLYQADKWIQKWIEEQKTPVKKSSIKSWIKSWINRLSKSRR